MDIDAKLDLIIKNLDYLTSKVTTLEKSFETLQSPYSYYKHPDYQSMGTTSEDPSKSTKWNASDLYSKDAMGTPIKPQASNYTNSTQYNYDGSKSKSDIKWDDKAPINQIKEQSTKSSTSNLLNKAIENRVTISHEEWKQNLRDLINDRSILSCDSSGKKIYILL